MNNKVKICICGDFVAPNVNQLKLGESFKDFIADSDINILNFEAPVKSNSKPISKSGPNNDQSPESPQWIEKNGFNVITLSNNHLMDFGDNGYKETITKFKSSKLVGAGVWNEAYKPIIIEKNGHKIAFMSLTHQEFGTLTDSYDKETIGCAWINHPSIDSIIIETKKKVDYLIILPHAGIECIEQPLPEWRERYKAFIDLGCDAVIASHPHIPQGWEKYKEKPIFYSLGNFYFPKKVEKPWFWYRSLCVSILLKEKELTFDVATLAFNNEVIDICKDNLIENYIIKIQEVLTKDNIYISEINQVCQNLLPQYYNLFYYGGLLNLKLNKIFINRVLKFLLKRNSFKKEHFINNIRCESHRWCISRALKNINHIR